MKDSLNEEITLELLSDLYKAIKEVTDTVLPQLGAEVILVTKPQLGIFIKVSKDFKSEHYPEFIKAGVVMRPTNLGRRLLHIGEE